ncbi:nucleoside phosphorylase [Scatolibacter rhodanostii]|uniref:nucleoside phosphorylase n=1 Tax=Scatolibacter rhodanostii TaxID=2014781 RepID=UPI000C070E27|nr:nucleoside phosphorylase [Scatolibacter rhodanostii]
MITDLFDLNELGVIEPSKIISPIDGFPAISIGAFSRDIVEEYVKKYNGVEIADLSTASVRQPIYKLTVDGTEIALHAPFVGAPTASASIEELGAMGAKYFVFFGMCGVLRHDIADGHLIVPDCAVRDEGLSYHYLAPSHEIELDQATVTLTKETLSSLDLPFVTGKVWTTDAFYRETASKIALRKKEGCICVDMECSALAAIAQYRNVPFAEFFFAADNLDLPEWDKRGLGDRGRNHSQIYMTAAIEIGKALQQKHAHTL